MSSRKLLPLVLVVLAIACGPEPREPAPTSEPAGAPRPAVDDRPVVVFLGDSITAGYGLTEDEAFPALIERELGSRGVAIRAVNAGESGGTSAGGLRRLSWILRQRPAVVVVELGANDGLRGLPLEETEENLRAIITRSKEAGARVLLVGMMLPPNYGPDYTERFRRIYPELAEELDVALMPFGLEDVAAVPELNLADGIHPNAEGHRIIAANLLPHLTPLL
ncbi:MAG: arylesterase [Acidobacteriota bacterium]|nr:arylesterase [Acidobacteriota bacterium]